MNETLIEPYLFFNGRCAEAMDFYQNAIGARVEISMTYKESPDEPPPGRLPGNWGDKIMHASLMIGERRVMLSDGCDTTPGFSGFSLSLALPDVETAKRAFDALADGGSVTQPLNKTFWSPCFGMLTDRFGLGWMVTIMPQQP